MDDTTRAAIMAGVLAMLGSAVGYLWVTVEDLKVHQAEAKQHILLLEMIKDSVYTLESKVHSLEIFAAVTERGADT